MFDFLDMMNNYEERHIDRTTLKSNDDQDIVVDTARVTDRDWLYETAVKHPEFNNGQWIIIEGCCSFEGAKEIHKNTVDFMIKDNYDVLTDIYDQIDYKRGSGNDRW